MTVQAGLGVGQRPWTVADVDLANGLPALPGVDGTGQPVGGAFVLVRVFSEPVAGLWVAVPDAACHPRSLAVRRMPRREASCGPGCALRAGAMIRPASHWTA